MLRAGLALCILAWSAHAAQLDPTIEKIVHDISQQRIADTMKKLTSFETRGNFTDPEQQNRGIGAARRWISDQFHSYDPRLDLPPNRAADVMHDWLQINVIVGPFPVDDLIRHVLVSPFRER